MPRQNSLPPHLQNQTSYMRAATSTPPPPPMSNGIPYQQQRQHTPQPQMISRPGSRGAVRRSSTNLGPSHLQQVTQPPQGQNGYAYMRTPPMYNTQAAQGMPAAPHHGHQSSQTSTYYNQLQQQAASNHPQVQQTYMQDQRRQSVPPTFQHDRPQQQSQQPVRMPSPPQPEQGQRNPEDQSRMQAPKPAKSRSIFTPIDDSRSLLAQHWGIGKQATEPKTDIKPEKDTAPQPSNLENVPQQQSSASHSPPTRTQSETPVPRRTGSTEFPPPSRADSMQLGAKRPKLKVHIPEEQSDAGSGESSKSQSGANAADTPAKASTEASHSSGTGVVLPPPSPSASAILSAGAQGPPNPFARPLPPSQGGPQQNNQAFNNNRDSIDTPISALPSRFVADALLPSPSSFYPEWGFGRSGGESANILPSPLNFQTPVTNGPSFGREDESERKRKSPEGESQEGANNKRIKA